MRVIVNILMLLWALWTVYVTWFIYLNTTSVYHEILSSMQGIKLLLIVLIVVVMNKEADKA